MLIGFIFYSIKIEKSLNLQEVAKRAKEDYFISITRLPLQNINKLTKFKYKREHQKIGNYE